MSLPDIAVMKADVDASLWQDITAAATKKDCMHYSQAFWAKAREAESIGNTKMHAASAVLGAVTSLYLKPAERKNPFGPMIVLTTSRSAMLDDLTEHHWQFLDDIADDISDAELRARVDDCLWVGRKKYPRALQAVDAYLDAAATLEDPQLWPPAADRIERALRLAASVRNTQNEQTFEGVIAYIESLLGKYEDNDSTHFSAKLMDLLLEFERGDAAQYAAYAEHAASDAELHGEWHWAHKYWDTAAQWHRLAGAVERRETALLLAAKTYIRDADSLVTQRPPDYFNAWLRLQKAIEALYPLEGTRQEREELHARMLSYQGQAVVEASHIGFPLDVTDMAEQVEAAIADKPLEEALLRFATLGKSPSLAYLSDLVQQISQVAVFSSSLPIILVSATGQVEAMRPGMGQGDTDATQEYLRAEMFSQARLWQLVHAMGMVEPARRRLTLDHDIRVGDLIFIVRDNPFVPPGRERYFARGLLAGFEGDFVVATHLLIPQVEHSLRHILSRRGLITSKLEQGIQDERDLGVLFYTYGKELEDALGPDTVFDLQGLLIERFGTNLRNLLAHGLLAYEAAQSFHGEYFWWLTWRICMLGFLDAQRAERPIEKDSEATASEGGSDTVADAFDHNQK